MTARLALGCVLAAFLAAAARVHVTIWLFGHAVARPPVAGLLLAVLALACAALLIAIWRACRGFRSSPYPRSVTRGVVARAAA